MKLNLPCRGAGYTFGATIVRKFLTLNGMNHILRAHQLCMEGYSVLYGDQLSTVWSAPNYCYRYVVLPFHSLFRQLPYLVISS